jgi:hypothetical protein
LILQERILGHGAGGLIAGWQGRVCVMGKDNLGRLAAVRSLETRRAEVTLRDAATDHEAQARRAAEVSAALAVEAPGNQPVTFGTWLTVQLACRQLVRATRAEAAAREEAALQDLVEARRAERMLEMLRDGRRQAAGRQALRREAATLTEIGARRRRRP